MEKKQLVRVAIVGPESTGKSTLAEALATHYNTALVPEVAREYVAALKQPYTLEDIVEISRQQLALEDELAANANRVLFCDTNLVVTKIWAEHFAGHCPAFIQTHFEARQYDLHLLTDIDLPWTPDPLREHPHLRQELFDLYKNLLDASSIHYRLVSGKGSLRTDAAIAFVDEVLRRV